MKTLAALVFAILFLALSFKSGQYYERYTIRPTIIANHGAHYDMTSGDFKWGSGPTAIELSKLESPQAVRTK